jgi:hypothetical protein
MRRTNSVTLIALCVLTSCTSPPPGAMRTTTETPAASRPAATTRENVAEPPAMERLDADTARTTVRGKWPRFLSSEGLAHEPLRQQAAVDELGSDPSRVPSSNASDRGTARARRARRLGGSRPGWEGRVCRRLRRARVRQHGQGGRQDALSRRVQHESADDVDAREAGRRGTVHLGDARYGPHAVVWA